MGGFFSRITAEIKEVIAAPTPLTEAERQRRRDDLNFTVSVAPLPQQQQIERTQVGPIQKLQAGATVLEKKIPSPLSIRHDFNIWHNYIKTLRTDLPPMQQFAITAKEVDKLLKILNAIPTVSPCSLREIYTKSYFSWNPDHSFLDFVDMMFRDAHSTNVPDYLPASDRPIKALCEAALSPALAQYLDGNYPLRYHPPNIPRDGLHLLPRKKKTQGFLNGTEFLKIIHKSHCVNTCPHKAVASNTAYLSATLISKPFIAARALHALSSNPDYPQTRLRAHIRQKLAAMDLFSPDSPFVLMQSFLIYLNRSLQELAGSSASILGDFTPIVDPTEYPLPLFKNPEGQLLGFFWHGTRSAAAKKIGSTSFQQTYSRDGLYGPNIYFAIEACKSLQYAPDTPPCLLLCAVFLGKTPYFTETNGSPPESPAVHAQIAAPGIANDGQQIHFEFVAQKESRIVPLMQFELYNKRPALNSVKPEHPELTPCEVM